jgi:hypothetical protein
MNPIPKGDFSQGSPLESALGYLRRGWSIIPIKVGTKKPACRSWKAYQKKPPDESHIRKWFSPGKDNGLAVICGPVSGGLVCRDYDNMAAYDAWASVHPDLAATLPTVATARGRHVYCRSGHRGIKELEDGELRGGGYCLLPPSRHPAGQVYQWLIPLPDGPLPEVENVAAAGFIPDNRPCNRENRDNGDYRDNSGKPMMTEAMSKLGPFSNENEHLLTNIPQDVEQAILDSIPTAVGQRNRQVFELDRALKAIPRICNADPADLIEYIRAWHKLGLHKGVIGSEPFEETWIDFLQGWPKVKFPRGKDPMSMILEQARRSPLPAAALKYDHAGLRLLVALCRALQRASGKQEFFLSTRKAASLLGLTTSKGQPDHVKAWRWLWLLTHNGILEPVEKGDRARRRATRYRYLGD